MKRTRSTLVAYKGLADASSKIAFFLVVVLAARALGREEFGLFSLAWALGWILSVASDAGLSIHVAREVAREPEAPQAVFRPCLVLRLLLAAAAAVVALAISASGFASPARAAFFVIAVAQITASLVDFVGHLFRGLSRSDIESGITLAGRVTVLAVVFVALAWRPTLGVLGLALLLPFAGMLAAALLVAARAGALRNDRPRRREGLARLRFVSDVLPMGIASLLSVMYFRVDLFVIDHFRGPEAVGLYDAVFRIVEAMRVLPAAALAVWFPVLCRARDLRPLGRLAGVLALAGAAVGALALPLAGRLTQFLYGAAFMPAAPVFMVLLLSVPLLFLNYALTHQLIGWNLQQRHVWLCAGALVVNVALNWLLVPRFGLMGAAWTTLVTELLITAGCVASLAITPRRALDRDVQPAFL